jgi:putative tricarboxylic transport membrane protein
LPWQTRGPVEFSSKRNDKFKDVPICTEVGMPSSMESGSFFAFVVFLLGFPVAIYFPGKQDCQKVSFILGPLFELCLRTALSIGDGNPLIFLTSPDSLFFLGLTLSFAISLPRVNKKAQADVIGKT